MRFYNIATKGFKPSCGFMVKENKSNIIDITFKNERRNTMRKWFVIPALLLLLTCVSKRGVQWFEGSLDEAMTVANQEGKQILVFAWSHG